MHIGIIGGGQLGMMLTQAAHKLNHKVTILDPSVNCSAGLIADKQIVAKFNNERALESLASMVDVLTYEFENIDYQLIKKLAKKYYIPQGFLPLKYSQQRFVEKTQAVNCGLNTNKFTKINTIEELNKAVQEFGYPCVLKTCRWGYDGKGQYVIRSVDDLKKASELLNVECLLEEYIDFDIEASVLIIRDLTGHIITYPAALNQHKNNILFKSTWLNNADINHKLQKAASDLMLKSDLFGILVIEFFIKDQEIYFNEMAPRPHNSFHASIEGCNISQFEALIRVITKMDIPPIKLEKPTVMFNVLGQDLKPTINYLSKNKVNATLHDYHKNEIKENRKMAHLTFYNTDIAKLNSEVSDYLREVYGE
ncbi:MAG: 5-(carboxyamino)imidazole ribonucleotide synthase [Erysipelotrichaceae bacterium]